MANSMQVSRAATSQLSVSCQASSTTNSSRRSFEDTRGASVVTKLEEEARPQRLAARKSTSRSSSTNRCTCMF